MPTCHVRQDAKSFIHLTHHHINSQEKNTSVMNTLLSYFIPVLPMRAEIHREVSNLLKCTDWKAGTLNSFHSPSLFNYENLNTSLKVYCLNLLVSKMGYYVCHCTDYCMKLQRAPAHCKLQQLHEYQSYHDCDLSHEFKELASTIIERIILILE